MKNTIFIILILFSIFNSFSQIIEVKQDGTGDYTSIQPAIDAAQTGDTVLVWPGTYYENIDFNSYGLTLGSLVLTTGDETYKHNTIIDGGKNGSCILIWNIDGVIEINGFTIQNGKTSNSYGGGIFIHESDAKILNNIIKNNIAKYGGGINCFFSNQLLLRGNSIYNNHAFYGGGGIRIGGRGNTVVLDSTTRNSIYDNFAQRGCDIFYTDEESYLSLFLDTCTVLNPDSYFVISTNESGFEMDNLEIDILNSVITPFDGNIYVAPVNGSNDNSGTTSEDPLQSIAMAYHKIHVDSLQKNTIHLANGIYSDSTNNEKFPLNIRPFINIVGESRDGVILDGNRNTYILKGNNCITDYSFKNMTLQGGRKPDYGSWEIYPMLAYLYTQNDRFVLDNIVFRDSYAKLQGILNYGSADSSMVKNCEFRNNTGNVALSSHPGNIQFIDNTKFINQKPDTNAIWPYKPHGGAVWVTFNGKDVWRNCLFEGNYKNAIGRSNPNGTTYIVNCTFNNNSQEEGKAAIWVADGSIEVYNSIFTNSHDIPFLIQVGEWQQMTHSHLNIYNSLIEGGEESIEYGFCQHSDTNWCHVHYDSTNIDTDPNFLGMWGDPYMIADGSPCIDAGTLANLPDFIELPEFDLAGNPRIVGDSIDIGAYEWNSTIVGFNEIGPGNREEKPKLLKASPNPFDWGTYLSVEAEAKVKEKGIKVEVYDNYGRLVRSILTTILNEKQEILWYGDDNDGNPLPAGIYHVVMFSGEREIESLKVVKK